MFIYAVWTVPPGVARAYIFKWAWNVCYFIAWTRFCLKYVHAHCMKMGVKLLTVNICYVDFLKIVCGSIELIET